MEDFGGNTNTVAAAITRYGLLFLERNYHVFITCVCPVRWHLRTQRDLVEIKREKWRA
jgi:hypothetical protein